MLIRSCLLPGFLKETICRLLIIFKISNIHLAPTLVTSASAFDSRVLLLEAAGFPDFLEGLKKNSVYEGGF